MRSSIADPATARARTWTVLVVTCHGALALLFGFALLHHGTRAEASGPRWSRARAVVLSGRGTAPDTSELLVAFHDRRGSDHRVWMRVESFGGATTGAHITVRYDPSRPDTTVEEGVDELSPWITVGMAVAAAVAAWAWRVRRQRRGRRQIEAAIELGEPTRPVRVWWASGPPGRLAIYDRWPDPADPPPPVAPVAGRMLGIQAIAPADQPAIHDAMEMELIGRAEATEQIALRAGSVTVVPATRLAAPADPRRPEHPARERWRRAASLGSVLLGSVGVVVLLRPPWNVVATPLAVPPVVAAVFGLRSGRHTVVEAAIRPAGIPDPLRAPEPPPWTPTHRTLADGTSLATLFPTLTAGRARRAARRTPGGALPS